MTWSAFSRDPFQVREPFLTRFGLCWQTALFRSTLKKSKYRHRLESIESLTLTSYVLKHCYIVRPVATRNKPGKVWGPLRNLKRPGEKAGATFQPLGTRSMPWPLRAAFISPHEPGGEHPAWATVESIVSSEAPFHLPHKAPDKLAQLTVFNEAPAPGWSQTGITDSEWGSFTPLEMVVQKARLLE